MCVLMVPASALASGGSLGAVPAPACSAAPRERSSVSGLRLLRQRVDQRRARALDAGAAGGGSGDLDGQDRGVIGQADGRGAERARLDLGDQVVHVSERQ